MRVLFLDQFSEPGGAQMCLRDVLFETRARGWAATVMAPGDGALFRWAEALRFETAPLPVSNYASARKSARDVLRFPGEMIQCRRTIQDQGRFDLYYVNGPRILPALAGTSVPVLFHSHNILDKRYTRLAVRYSLGRRVTLLGCSKFVARPLESQIGRPVKVVYNGIADCGFRQRPSVPDFIRVGILGRIAREKGHLDFVRAAQLLPDRHRIRFIAVGAALFSDPVYEHEVRELGQRENVEFRGWTDTPAQTLHELDILAVPSASVDASPRVIMEALSAGTVVVAYPSGGIPELIRSGHDGLVTKECTSEALAASIGMLATRHDLRHTLAANGRKTWQKRFTAERFRREVCDEMRALCSSETRSGSKAESRAGDTLSAFP